MNMASAMNMTMNSMISVSMIYYSGRHLAGSGARILGTTARTEAIRGRGMCDVLSSANFSCAAGYTGIH